MPIPLPIIKFLIRTGIAQRLPAVKALVPDPSYLRFYSDRILMAPNEPVAAMNAYLSRANHESIDLSLGAPAERALRPSYPAGNVIDARTGYPPAIGLAELRTAVADKLSMENRVNVDPQDEVSIVNGVSQAIHVVFDTFVNPGDKIVLVDPTFLVYPLAAQYHRAQVAWVPSRLHEGRTILDYRRLERVMRGAKLVVVNSPSNPTGGVLHAEDLANVLELARRYDVLVLSDEVYERFVYESEHTSIASLPGARERTITVNSFSKTHAMAGCRIGYIAAIRYLMRPMMAHQFIATPFVSTASQLMGLAALKAPKRESAAVMAEYSARRRWIHRALADMGFECDLPSGAFYFWLPLERFGLTSLEFAHRLLESQNVLLMPGENFGPSGSKHIRISYAAADSKVREGCARLAQFVRELDTPANSTFRADSKHHPAHQPPHVPVSTRALSPTLRARDGHAATT